MKKIKWINVLLGCTIVLVLFVAFFINSEGYKEQQLITARIEIYCEGLVITTASMKINRKNSYLTGKTRLGDIYGDLIERAENTVDKHCDGYL